MAMKRKNRKQDKLGLPLDDLLRLPNPPRRLPWLIHWYLLFHSPGSHVGWGIFCFILLLFVGFAPDFGRRLFPWHLLRSQVCETTFTITAVDQSTLPNDEVSFGPDEPVNRYYYEYTDDRGAHHHSDDTGEYGGGYHVGERVSGQYVRRLPSFSRLPEIHAPYEFSMPVVFLMLFLLPGVAIIVLSIKINTPILRLLVNGRFAPIEKDPLPETPANDGEPMPSAAKAQFMAWNGTLYDVRAYRRHTAWVLYLPYRPSEHFVLPIDGINLPCHVDAQGQIRLLPGKALFVVALPTLYLFLVFWMAYGLYTGLLISVCLGALLLVGLRQGVGRKID